MISFKQLITELRNPKAIQQFKAGTQNVTAVDNRETEWVGTASQLMSQYGFVSVGGGKYGHVFLHPKYKYVIKVFMKDTAYLRWLNFAKAHQHNKYVPKIRGKVVRLGPNFMAVRLEQLSPYPSSKDPLDHIIFDQAETHKERDAVEVQAFFDRNEKLLDLHYGNFMIRPNGQGVIVDPFYNFFRDGKFTIDPNDTSQFSSLFVKP